MLFLFSLLLVAAPHVPWSPEPSKVEQPASWMTVLDEGRLQLERDQYVRFEGVGRLAFGTDRREVHAEAGPLPTVLVDGTPIFGRYEVTPDETLELRGTGGTRWVIRLASEDEVAAIADAVRIRDDRPGSPARLDTDEPTLFYLYIDARGGSTFTYPEA